MGSDLWEIHVVDCQAAVAAAAFGQRVAQQ